MGGVGFFPSLRVGPLRDEMGVKALFGRYLPFLHVGPFRDEMGVKPLLDSSLPSLRVVLFDHARGRGTLFDRYICGRLGLLLDKEATRNGSKEASNCLPPPLPNAHHGGRQHRRRRC